MAVEAPVRRFLAPLTAETIYHPHSITKYQTLDDFEQDLRTFLCKTVTGERWRLTIPLSQRVYPNRSIYDIHSLDSILTERQLEQTSKVDEYQLGQDHGINFISYPEIWDDFLDRVVSVDSEEIYTTTLNPPSTFIEIATNGNKNAERMDFAARLRNGAILAGELSTLESTLSRKHKQIREYAKKMKYLLISEGIECDIIPFYIQCGYDQESKVYTLKFRRVKKDPQSDDFTQPF